MATEQSIGTARIDLVVDTERMRADLKMAKNLVSQMGDEYAASFNKMSAAQKRVELETLRFAATQGKSREEIRLMRLEAQGASEAVLKLAREQVAASRAVQGTSAAVNAATVNVKQLQQAVRFLPAQFTDIATSLAGGANPLLVGLQQGGQILDQFRLAGVGVGGTVRQIGASLMGLVNPVTLAAAASVALGTAWYQGSREAKNLNEALILTGNNAGTTVDHLSNLAAEFDKIAGVTQRSSTKALAEVTATGRFTAEQLALVTESALRWEAATGRAVSETVAEFEEIRKKPVEALLALHERVNFLTQAQLENIAALKAQGREQEAVTEAIRIWADTSTQRTTQVTENLGYIERGWRSIKEVATEAWDAMLGIGRATTAVDQIENLERNIAGLRAGEGLYREMSPQSRSRLIERMQAQIEQLQRRSAEQARGPVEVQWQGIYAPASAARHKASEEWDRLALRHLTDRQRMEREIAEARKVGLAAGKSELEIERQVAAIRKDYEDKEARRGGRQSDPSEGIIARLRQQIALNREQVEADERLTASERLRVQTQEDLERIGGTLTGTRRQLIDELLQELDVTGKLAQAHLEEARGKEQLARLNAQLAAGERNQRAANDLDLLSMGRGADQVDQLRRRLAIERDYEEGLRQLRDRGVAEDSASYRAQEAALRASRDRMLREEEDYQRRRMAALGDWGAGATAALEDFLAETRDVSAYARDFMGDAMRSFGDVVRQVTMTGKADVKEMVLSWIADFARLRTNQAMAQFLAAVWPAGGGVQRESLSTAGLWGFAKGGVLVSEDLSAHSSSIVTKPTLFAFAKGAGLMGEAGPEAIMPLRRGRDGRLGVQAVSGGGVQVQVNNYAGVRVESREESQRMPDGRALQLLVLDLVADDLSAGGRTAAALRSRFGLRESV